MIILDEFSMVKADLLYQMDLRLRELLQNTSEPSGGCSLLMFGDLLQLRLVMGKLTSTLNRLPCILSHRTSVGNICCYSTFDQS